MQFALFWPLEPADASYSRSEQTRDSNDLPVPPRALRATYGLSAESYLASGKEDCEAMSDILAATDFKIETADLILDLGCAAGRMTRWLPGLAPAAQVWGADIWSEAIMWCQENLSPPCHFMTTTMVPHLPFPDCSVDVTCCGSLFTHVDDLVDMWFMELHRIIRPGGRLYFSVNDRNAVEIFDGTASAADYPAFWDRTAGKENWDEYIAILRSQPEYQRFCRREAYMVSVSRSMQAQVLWDADVLCDKLAWGWKRLSVTPQAYGHQTAILLERL